MKSVMNADYRRIARAIDWLGEHHESHPSLEEAARVVRLSPFHFQRMFRRLAGVSPTRFVQFLTLDHAKAKLLEDRSLLEVSLDAGLSGPSRLHDLFVAIDGTTPGEFKSGGEGIEIAWGVHPTPFGECLVATTSRGVCALRFGADLEELREEWPRAQFRQERARTESLTFAIFGHGERPPLHVFGTNFQLKVWEALLRIPDGEVVSYQALAESVGRPNAARAVGTAVGRNPVAWLIPCHRVLRKVGTLGGYRWGERKKRAMLAWEGARA
jgi:AraC family transcriptional regulator, regulatory protein of adaptative response / methylated-DNA-[protein]-cysteine methyltransferase